MLANTLACFQCKIKKRVVSLEIYGLIPLRKRALIFIFNRNFSNYIEVNFLVVDSRAKVLQECGFTLKTRLGEIFLLLFLAHGSIITEQACQFMMQLTVTWD